MTKTTLGSLANASAAVALVARCAALLNPDTAAFYSGVVGLEYADRWRARVAADGAPFTFWALLIGSVAVKNNADGVIYKCLRDPAFATPYTNEKTRLDAANTAGKTWCPDYWYYDAAPNVMCLREYALYATAGTVYSRSDAVGFIWPGAFPNTAETTDMQSSGAKPSGYTIAFNAITGKYVLIDGTQ